jgi:AbrB family looped-hinge helix DNA binding protein
MDHATSRVTTQNQVSIPAEVRRRFGIKPGSELVWEEKDGELRVRPKQSRLEDVQEILAAPPSGARTLAQLRDGKIAAATRKTARGRGR